MESSGSQTGYPTESPWGTFSSPHAWLRTSGGSDGVDAGEQVSVCSDTALEYLLDFSRVSEQRLSSRLWGRVNPDLWTQGLLAEQVPVMLAQATTLVVTRLGICFVYLIGHLFHLPTITGDTGY